LRLIDSHCHLDFPDFSGELDQVIARAKSAGVERMITIGTRLSQAERLQKLAADHEDVFFTVGTHPHNAAEEPDFDAERIRAFARDPKCVGLGEAGLDYHYKYSPAEVAKRIFRAHIGLARELGLPLVIHTREADDDVAEILRQEMAMGAFKAILHCFTSSRALAMTGLELGLYVSFSGVVTFKNSQALREIARDVPIERMLVETDAPYLAPVPHRGNRNEPALVADTARVLAELKGLTPDEFADFTRANTLDIFDKIEGRA
jgi:TatD DNase family protein